MKTLTSNELTSSEPTATGVVASQLTLHIVQPGCPEKTMSLAPGKCTVGSSARCQIQLSSSQVRPLHCLIIHRAEETIVKRWAPGALLNDQEFTTATFHPGDHLRIGDVDVCLVPQNQIPPAQPQEEASVEPAVAKDATDSPQGQQPAPSPRPVANLEPSAASPPTSSEASSLDSDRLVRQLYGARQRCRKLVSTLRDTRVEKSSFDQQIDHLQEQIRKALDERELISGELNQFQSESVEKENQATQEMDRLISELNIAYEKSNEADAASAQHAQQCDKLRDELKTLHAKQEKVDEFQSAYEQERSNFVKTLEEHEQNIAELEGQLRTAIQLAEARGTQQTTNRKMLEAKLRQLQNERGKFVADQDEYRQQKQATEQSVAERDSQIEQLRNELEQAKTTTLSAEELVDEQGRKYQDLQTALQQAEEECEQLKGELEQSGPSEENDGQQSADGEGLQTKLDQLEKERDRLLESQSECQKDWEQTLAGRDRHQKELYDEIDGLRASAQVAEQQVLEHVANTDKLQQELTELQQVRDQLLEAKAEQAASEQKWEQTLAKRDRCIEELRAENQLICESQEVLDEETPEQIGDYKRLEQQLAEACEERDKIAAAQAEREKHLRELEESLQNQAQQTAELSEKLANLGNNGSELESELEEWKSAAGKFEAEASELRSRCEDFSNEYESGELRQQKLKQILSDQKNEIQKLSLDLNVAHQQKDVIESSLNQLVISCEGFEEERKEFHARGEQLFETPTTESARCQELESALSQRQERVDVLEADLLSVRDELQYSAEHVEQLEEKCNLAELESSTLEKKLKSEDSNSAKSSDPNKALLEERDELLRSLEEAKKALKELVQKGEVSSGAADNTATQNTTWEEEKSALEAQAAKQQQTVEQLSIELERARSELSAEQTKKEQIDQLYQQSQRGLADASKRMVSAEKVLLDQMAKMEAVQTVKPSAPVSNEQPTKNKKSPTSTVKAFAKQGFSQPSFIEQYSQQFEEDNDPNNDPSSPLPAESNEPSAAVETTESEDAEFDHGEEDAALKSYTQDMMQRVNGGSMPEEVAAENLIEVKPKGLIDLESLRQTSQRPDLSIDLVAMRELANSTAHQAISKHSKRNYLASAFSKFLISAMSAGIAYYILFDAEDYYSARSIGGWAAGAVAVLWGLSTVGVLLAAVYVGYLKRRVPIVVPVDEKLLSADQEEATADK